MKNYLALGLLLSMLGCGPGNSALESEEAQRREIRNQKILELDLVVGSYEGELVRGSGNKKSTESFKIQIIRSEKIISSSSGVPIQVPTLMGLVPVGNDPAGLVYPQGDFQIEDRRFILQMPPAPDGRFGAISGTIIGDLMKAELIGGIGLGQISARRTGR